MKKMIAEFIGTLVLVVFGCGSAVALNTIVNPMVTGGVTPLAITTLAIAFAFGLVIVAMAYSIGNVSGCHINPAVSFGMLVSGRMSLGEFGKYIVAQFLGGIAGAGILAGIFGSTESLGQNGFGAASALGTGMAGALIIEIILTFVFVIAVLGVTSKSENGNIAGIVIGLTLTLVHILGVPFTGTSVNPARSLGPAIFAGGEALAQVWVFIAAPLIGAALAAIVYKFITSEK